MEQLQEYKYFKDEKEEKQSNKLFIKFIVILFVVFSFIFCVVSIYHSNFQYVKITGCSMQPTLNENPIEVDGYDVQDGVYIKLTKSIDYGDIVVIDKDKKSDKDDLIIKRALAFGGDYVTIASISYNDTRDYRFMRVKQGHQEVEIIYEDYIKSYAYWNSYAGSVENGVEYENPLYTKYLSLNYETKVFSLQLGGQEKEVVFFKVPENNIFYMGDNRTGSLDARINGTELKAHVLGKVVKIVNNGTFIQEEPAKWFFQQISDFFSIVWKEISIFFGAKA